MPSASRFTAVPETIWSARRRDGEHGVDERRARRPPPSRSRARRPTSDVTSAPQAPKKAPAQHHPLEPDVDHARALGDHAAERGEGRAGSRSAASPRRSAPRRRRARGCRRPRPSPPPRRRARHGRRRSHPSRRARSPPRSAMRAEHDADQREHGRRDDVADRAAAGAPDRTRTGRARRRPSRSTPRRDDARQPLAPARTGGRARPAATAAAVADARSSGLRRLATAPARRAAGAASHTRRHEHGRADEQDDEALDDRGEVRRQLRVEHRRIQVAHRRAVDQRGEQQRGGGVPSAVLRPSSATAMPRNPIVEPSMSLRSRRNCQPRMSSDPARPAKAPQMAITLT